MVEEEKLETPERFICVQLKGSKKVTVIDVCAFLKRANNKNAKTKYEYADALLATSRPFDNMQEAQQFIDKTEIANPQAPLYIGTKHIICEEGQVCSFLIRAVNQITDNYSVHTIESASFEVETDGIGEIVLPLFLYFEKLGNLLSVSKEEANNKDKDSLYNTNKVPYLITDKMKEDLYKKLTPPEKGPQKQETEGYQELDR